MKNNIKLGKGTGRAMWLVKKSGLGLVAPLGKEAELPGGITVLSARLCSPGFLLLLCLALWYSLPCWLGLWCVQKIWWNRFSFNILAQNLFLLSTICCRYYSGGWGGAKKVRCEDPDSDWLQILHTLLTNFVTLGKWFNLFALVSSCVEVRIIRVTSS